MWWSNIIILLTSFILANAQKDYPKVTTPLGKIRGYYKRSENNKPYKAFEGIPFARPPVDKLRFEAPQRVLPWTNELLATKTKDNCIHYFFITPNNPVAGSEDCLYLNIYVPIQDSPMPVIFWFFGGTFLFGSGSLYGGKYIVDKNVIFVTFNHRLGPFGFLSTEDDVVSGNMGLKDQSMALRWINENIKYFGGDPKKITLLGFSSGAASVHYHYLSPLSAGLFQNGISVSGTALISWAQDENSLEKAKKLGSLMGCPTNITKVMVECLKARPARSIMETIPKFLLWIITPYAPFAPVAEKSKKGYFINQSPVKIITKGEAYNVPWITGVVSEEGIFPIATIVKNDTRLKDLNDNWDKIAPSLLEYYYTLPQNQHTRVARIIRKHYFGLKAITKQSTKPLIKMTSDRLYISDSIKAAKLHAKHSKSPLWYYYYTFRASASLSYILSGTKENFGVSHSDDIYLVLEQRETNFTNTVQDRAMREYLLNFYTSVAKTGKPDIKGWSRVNPAGKALNYLHIYGPSKAIMESNDNIGDYKYWNSFNFNENKY